MNTSPSRFTMTECAGTSAIPHKLCQWCKKVIQQLRSSLSTSLEHDRLLYHYPSVQAFLHGTLRDRCHLCSIFAGWLAQCYKTDTVEQALEKSGKCENRADSALVTVMKNSSLNSTGVWQAFDLFTGFELDDRTLDTVASAALYHSKRGVGQDDTVAAMLLTLSGSDENYAMVKRWLGTCTSEHVACRRNAKRRAPTRLLDLEMRDTKHVRLVTGSSTAEAPYAALSYRWGSIPQLMLLPSNYSSFEKRIPFASLTKVAQDAVTVCRAMSVRYLWIDAMCIIQGPDGDFQQEAARIEDVYCNAVFTITAAASTDTTQPFLVHRDPLWWVDCQLKTGESMGYQSYIEGNSYCNSNDNVPGAFAIDSRGWCFQEQFLSPRSIYFGTRGIHWECRMGVLCEHFPKMGQHLDDRQPSSPARKSMFNELVSLGDDLSDPTTHYKLRELWGSVIYEYSGTRLTHCTDKLVALAGIASMVENKFNLKASFGLWLDFFLDELLWFVEPRLEGEAVCLGIAPSWSWANLDECAIFGANTLHSNETGEEHYLDNSFSATVVSLPRVTGFTTPMRSLTVGDEAPVRLRGWLTACLRRTSISCFTEQLINRLDPKDCALGVRQDVGRYYPDTEAPETDLYCFLIRREHRRFKGTNIVQGQDADEIWDHCLVLTPVQESRTRFRRTGTYGEVSEHKKYDRASTNMETKELYTHMFAAIGEEQEVELV